MEETINALLLKQINLNARVEHVTRLSDYFLKRILGGDRTRTVIDFAMEELVPATTDETEPLLLAYIENSKKLFDAISQIQQEIITKEAVK